MRRLPGAPRVPSCSGFPALPVSLHASRTLLPRLRSIAAALLAVAVAFACSSSAKGTPVEPGGVAGPLSLSVSSVSVSDEIVPVGRTIVISVMPTDVAGRKIGEGLAVAVTVSGGTSAGTLSDVSFFAFDSSYRATYTGEAVGTALTVRATINGGSVASTRQLTVQEPPPQLFTSCSRTGEICTFTGLRDVRLVTSGGQTYTQAFYGSVPCAASGYDRGFTGAPDAAFVRCEVGEQKWQTMPNITRGMAGLDAASLRVPRGDDGVPRHLVRAAELPQPPSGEGSFRMTCELAKMDFFDPIVYPGAAGSSHLHMFFGNVGVSPGSTTASLTATGAGSCTGGTVNRTGYWVPAAFDVRTSEVITPSFATIYYKTGYNVDPAAVRTIPAGLMMIAGDRNNVGKAQVINQLEVASWACETAKWTNTGAVPSCPVGDIVRLTINFPQCWDGVNLDSPDHKRHMAYPIYRNPPERSVCPSTHPVMLPIISEIFRWPVTAGMNPAFWRLTSDMYAIGTRGGYSAHADWMNGWQPQFLDAIVNNCLKPGRDCGVNLLGDGRELY